MSLSQLTGLPIFHHQGDVQIFPVQFYALREPEAVLLDVTQVFDFPAVLFQLAQAAVCIQGNAAFAARRRQAANPPDQVRHGQAPTQLFAEQLFRRRGFVAALSGHFQRDIARAPGQAGSATLFWLQRQDYYDIRLSGPLGRGAAGVFRGADADFAVDLPTVELGQMLFMR